MAGLKLTPIILKEVNRYLTSPKKVRKFGFDQPPVKTGKDIKRPEDPFREFEERNPQADGGRAGFQKGKKVLPKNIRLTPQGQYRFSSQAGDKNFSKIFPKGTKLEEVEKFRDGYLKQFGIEEGRLRKVNPDRGKYIGVKDQKHIKFNGVTYQVAVQRMKDGKMVTEKPFTPQV